MPSLRVFVHHLSFFSTSYEYNMIPCMCYVIVQYSSEGHTRASMLIFFETVHSSLGSIEACSIMDPCTSSFNYKRIICFITYNIVFVCKLLNRTISNYLLFIKSTCPEWCLLMFNRKQQILPHTIMHIIQEHLQTIQCAVMSTECIIL